MPWQEQSKMSLKAEFVALAELPDANLSALCRQFGISRPTGYQLIARYRAHGVAGLAKRLGFYGFGAAAHGLIQVVRHEGRVVYAFTRPSDRASQQFARSPGAVWAGGTVVCAGIHMSDIPSFPYDICWGERSIRSVANLILKDGEAFLAIASSVSIHTEVTRYPTTAANEALADLHAGRLQGGAVLVPGLAQ